MSNSFVNFLNTLKSQDNTLISALVEAYQTMESQELSSLLTKDDNFRQAISLLSNPELSERHRIILKNIAKDTISKYLGNVSDETVENILKPFIEKSV
jgi:hypothetical protein